MSTARWMCLGQAAMTEAMFDWLDDYAALHPLNLDAALLDFEEILALYSQRPQACGG